MKKRLLLATALLSLNVSAAMTSAPSDAKGVDVDITQFISDKIKDVKASAPDDVVTVHACYLNKPHQQPEPWSCNNLTFTITKDDLRKPDATILESTSNVIFYIAEEISKEAEGNASVKQVELNSGTSITVGTDRNIEPYIEYSGGFLSELDISAALIGNESVGLPRSRHINFSRPLPAPNEAIHSTLTDANGLYFYAIFYTGEKVNTGERPTLSNSSH